MLELRNVSKRFGGALAVDDVSFRARAGGITGYLGPNGSGKSTTLKMIVGLIGMTSGDVSLNGRSARQDAIGWKQRLGYVPEEPHLYAHLSGLEYLVMVGQLRDLPARPTADRIDGHPTRARRRGTLWAGVNALHWPGHREQLRRCAYAPCCSPDVFSQQQSLS